MFVNIVLEAIIIHHCYLILWRKKRMCELNIGFLAFKTINGGDGDDMRQVFVWKWSRQG
jgi:hypothetical protein